MTVLSLPPDLLRLCSQATEKSEQRQHSLESKHKWHSMSARNELAMLNPLLPP